MLKTSVPKRFLLLLIPTMIMSLFTRVNLVDTGIPQDSTSGIITYVNQHYTNPSGTTGLTDPNTYGAAISRVSDQLQVLVNGTDVGTVQYADVNYSRFAISGPGPYQITVNVKNGASLDSNNSNINPIDHAANIKCSDRQITFTIDQPRNLYIDFNNALLDHLVIIADPEEDYTPDKNDAASVLVVTSKGYVDITNGSTEVTQSFQKALQAVSKMSGGKGGILYVPNGIYLLTTLYIPSNVTVYLENGALLQAKYNGTYAKPNGHAAFIVFGNADGTPASNAKLIGRGTVDCNGFYARRVTGAVGKMHTIETQNGCSNIVIKDVYIRNAASWTVHLEGVNGFFGMNYKIINDLRKVSGSSLVYMRDRKAYTGVSTSDSNIAVSNSDGTDPDGAKNVYIDGIFERTFDDAIAVKVSDQDVDSSNIFISRSVFWSMKTGLKIGTENYGASRTYKPTISNVSFQDNIVIHTDRVLGIYSRGSTSTNAGLVKDVTYRNNRGEYIAKYTGDKKSHIYFTNNYNSNPPGNIGKVQVIDYTVTEPSYTNVSTIAGTSDFSLSGPFEFYNFPCTIKQPDVKYAPIPVYSGSYKNRPPVLKAISTQPAMVGSPLQITLDATDPDGDPLTYSMLDNAFLPTGASLHGNTFTWTPQNAGIYGALFKVSDGEFTDYVYVTIPVYGRSNR